MDNLVFEQMFDMKDITNLKQKKDFDINSYATFCINYVNSLSKVLNFEAIFFNGFKKYKIDIPIVKNNRSKHLDNNVERDNMRIKQKGAV